MEFFALLWPIAVLLVVLVAAVYQLDRWLHVSDDLVRFGDALLALMRVKYLLMWRQTLVPDLFEQLVDQNKNEPCVVTMLDDNVTTIKESNGVNGKHQHNHHEDKSVDTWSFWQLDQAANRVANWALAKHLQPGENVVLLMENRVEFLVAWLGLTKVGVVTACVNTHIRHEALAHCLKVADASYAIVGTELVDAVQEIADQFPSMTFVKLGQVSKEQKELYANGWHKANGTNGKNGVTFATSLESELATMSTTRPDSLLRRRHTKPRDPLMLIYTSGTTGFPKAAKISHSTFLTRAICVGMGMRVTPEDRVYCSMPLYHATGGNIAAGLMMCCGATLCLAKRFSVSKFFDEVVAMDCTLVCYIGEMCTYLVKMPPKSTDGQGHRVRMAFGNGMRSEIWPVFQQRFQIPAITEFYGSTEGTVQLMNICWNPNPKDQGHLGQYGFMARQFMGNRILRYDLTSQDLVRDPTTGFCIECKPNEVGELVGPASSWFDPLKQFNGYYKNPSASNKKLARDVFRKGDVFFRTGDLFRADEEGRFYFMDRVGDTFRWKGENVATSEVTAILNKFDDQVIRDLCVYGVQIPGHEGRACMTALVVSCDKTNNKQEELTEFFAQFVQFTQQKLPSYAVPVFVRLVAVLEKTGTQKLCTTALREQGMDPRTINDPIWYLNRKSNRYEPLTRENFEQVLACTRL